MNSDWKFKLAFCFIALYVIGINCDNDPKSKQDEKDKKDTLHFNSSFKVGDQNQINCEPDDLCKKFNFTDVECTGYFDKLETKNYTCSIGQLTKKDVDYNNYTISCLEKKKDKDEVVPNINNGTCWIDVTLSAKPEDKGSSVGLIVGITILVIAVLGGIVAFLGYQGIGPMKRLFNN